LSLKILIKFILAFKKKEFKENLFTRTKYKKLKLKKLYTKEKFIFSGEVSVIFLWGVMLLWGVALGSWIVALGR